MFRFLKLPGELRNLVYGYVLSYNSVQTRIDGLNLATILVLVLFFGWAGAFCGTVVSFSSLMPDHILVNIGKLKFRMQVWDPAYFALSKDKGLACDGSAYNTDGAVLLKAG